jgi:hypothetical protein
MMVEACIDVKGGAQPNSLGLLKVIGSIVHNYLITFKANLAKRELAEPLPFGISFVA